MRVGKLLCFNDEKKKNAIYCQCTLRQNEANITNVAKYVWHFCYRHYKTKLNAE